MERLDVPCVEEAQAFVGVPQGSSVVETRRLLVIVVDSAFDVAVFDIAVALCTVVEKVAAIAVVHAEVVVQQEGHSTALDVHMLHMGDAWAIVAVYAACTGCSHCSPAVSHVEDEVACG